MNYRNSEIKLDQIVSYLNDEKINLSPAFQRGHVWTVGTRAKLIKNIVQGKPIPAIFLYKEASGSRYSYNILDGKQRLESLILFIGSARADFAIKNWDKYFFGDKAKKDANFEVELSTGKHSFADLDDTVVRDFREYAIPTIEITLSDESALDEIITLFVDINQQGVPVNRFDIVKAMGKGERLLQDVFKLLAIEQKRGQDIHYKVKRNEFTNVLKRLQIIEKIQGGNSKVDRMWERLLEIVLFSRTKKHRKPVEILKGFLGSTSTKSPRLTGPEVTRLRKVFRFLEKAYKHSDLGASRLATDQTHFYIMITALIGNDLIGNFSASDLTTKLVRFGNIIDNKAEMPKERGLVGSIKKYLELSARQTTDVGRRDERLKMLTDAISAL